MQYCIRPDVWSTLNGPFYKLTHFITGYLTLRIRNVEQLLWKHTSSYQCKHEASV